MEEAVVFGLGPAGLFLSRQLYRMGARVYGIGRSDDIGRYSRCLYKSFTADTPTELLNCVIGILNDTKAKPQGWICSDGYLTEIIEEHPEILTMLNFIEPSVDILKMMANKDELMRIGTANSVPFPIVFNWGDSVKFPVVVKPNIKQKKSPLPKIMYAASYEELDNIIKAAGVHGIMPKDFIIQQAIRGNNNTEYGYGGYFRCGAPICDVAFIQVRQYPQGVSCYAIEITDDGLVSRIKRAVTPFLKYLNYSGFVQFDLKEDSETSELFVLDINPRPWGSVSLLLSKTDTRHTIFNPLNRRTKVVWRFPLKEILSLRNKKNVSYKRCRQLAKGKTKTIIDLWSIKDPLPFLMQPVIICLKLFRL